MAITTFTPVTWGDEPIFKDKLNTMSNNTQYVFERMPKVTYSAHGVKKPGGVKILAGINIIPASNASVNTTNVYFGDFFSSGCKPIIVTGHLAPSPKWRWVTAHRGLGHQLADHRGMILYAGPDYAGSNISNILDTPVYVHWIAIGY